MRCGGMHARGEEAAQSVEPSPSGGRAGRERNEALLNWTAARTFALSRLPEEVTIVWDPLAL